MKSKRQNYDSVQSLIIATAARLFTERGADGASLNDIAKAADIAKGTLYYYYPAKDGLIADTARTHGDWMGDTLLAWAETLQRDTDAHKAMKSLLHELLWDEMHAKLHVVLVSHAAIAGGELSALMDAMRKKWALMLEVGSLKLQSNDARTIQRVLLHAYWLHGQGRDYGCVYRRIDRNIPFALKKAKYIGLNH